MGAREAFVPTDRPGDRRGRSGSARSRQRQLLADFDALAEARETQFRRVALRLFAGERESIDQLWSRLVEQSGGRLKIDDPIAQAAIRAIERSYAPDGIYHKRWLASYGTLIGETIQVGGRNISAATGFDFSLSNPRARDAANQRAQNLATVVGETSGKRVTAIIAEATQTGRSTRDIAKAIKNEAFGGEITAARAKRIAITESRGALNHGEYLSAQEGGIETKIWRHSGNPNFRETHLALEGKRVALDEMFTDGLILPMRFAGDPEGAVGDLVNCHCAVEYAA